MSLKLTSAQKTCMWVIVFVVLVAFLAVAIHFLTASNTIGNDILVFYMAAQSTFKHGQSPYLSENAILSQLLTYGKLAQPGEDYLTFSYPPFALMPLFLLVWLPFDWAQAIWMASLILGLVIILLLSFPKAPRWLAVSVFLLYPITFGLLMGNFVILILIILIANIYFLFSNQANTPYMEIFLAIALAWTAVKPQFSWLYLIFFLIVAMRQRRKVYLLSFACSLGLFILISFIISPDWVQAWINQVSYYAQTNPVQLHLIAILSLILPTSLVRICDIVLIPALLFWVGRYIYKYKPGKNDWLLILIVIGFCGHLLYPGGVAYQRIIFLIPFIVWMSTPQTSQAKYIKPLIWLLAIILSWMELIGPRLISASIPYNEWLFAGYSLWMIFILRSKSNINSVT